MSDFWTLQTIGLMMVTLACVLAGDTAFGLLLFLYLVCLVWCLAGYYQARERCHAAGLGLQAPLFGDGGTDPRRSRALPELGSAFRWSLAVGFFSLLMFFAAPHRVAGSGCRTGFRSAGQASCSPA